MEKANDNQVGGNHYQSTFQHWDLVVVCGLGYFEGQVTKYVSRWKSKGGVQDLRKAAHFAHKMMEVIGECPSVKISVAERKQKAEDFCKVNKISGFEAMIIKIFCAWNSKYDIGIGYEVLVNYIETVRPSAQEGSAA